MSNIREILEEDYEDFELKYEDPKYDYALVGYFQKCASLDSFPLYDQERIGDMVSSDFNGYTFQRVEIEKIKGELLIPDGHNSDYLGVCYKDNKEMFAIYCKGDVITSMMKDFRESFPEMSEQEVQECAVENYYYNFVGGYMGEHTWVTGDVFEFEDEY